MGSTQSSQAACRAILIVEDDSNIRSLLAEALRSEGYSVLEAANGREGLNLLETKEIHPCLVLLDLMMPVLNGWEFLAELKKDNADIIATLPVYVISAAGEHATEAKKQASGFIKKPLELDDLFKIVERHCGQ